MRTRDDQRAHAATAIGVALARAALAGNPSDGYGGAVLAVCLPDFSASVELSVAGGGPEALAVEPVEATALLAAAAAQHAAATRCEAPALRGTVRTTIPREVGLGGSSAIVIATFRALDAALGTTIGRDELPALALAAEAQLGIAAGLQDRVAQAYGGLTAMRFGDGGFTARALDPALLPPLYVAWAPGSASPSGAYHAELRARFGAGDRRVGEVMARLAAAAASAAAAIERGDTEALGAAMDESFDLRAALGPLDERHAALVHLARGVGLCANYAGSGGAIVGLACDAERVAALTARLTGEGGHAIEVSVR